jgi:hypothetical protein
VSRSEPVRADEPRRGADSGSRQSEAEEERALLDRAPGDDVVVAVRLRRSSFDALTSTSNGRSVAVSAGMIGLVPDAPERDRPVWTFVVWSPDPVWRGVPEQIPGNALAAEALIADALYADDGWSDEADDGWDER